MLAILGFFGAAMGGLFLIERDDDALAEETIPLPDEDAGRDGIEQMLSASESWADADAAGGPDAPDPQDDGPVGAPVEAIPAGAPGPAGDDDAGATDAASGEATDGGDRLLGSAADDSLVGLTGDDVLYGLDGDDLLTAGSGDDALFGGAGDDTLAGGFGDDELVGGTGADLLQGGWGNDLLDGRDSDDGFDYLNGGEGDDTLIAGRGDYLSGGGGADRFVVARDFGGTIDDMTDEDRLELTWDRDTPPALEAVGTDAGVEIRADGDRVALLRGLERFDLDRIELVMGG